MSYWRHGTYLITGVQWNGVFASHLVGKAEKVRAARRRVLEDILFSLGFCQIHSMFGEVLGLLIFLFATTILPGFPASLIFLGCTIDSCVPPPGLGAVFVLWPKFDLTRLYSCLILDLSLSFVKQHTTPCLFSPPVFLGRPAKNLSCLQQTGHQLSPDLFFTTTTSIAWGRLWDKRLLLFWLSLSLPEVPDP